MNSEEDLLIIMDAFDDPTVGIWAAELSRVIIKSEALNRRQLENITYWLRCVVEVLPLSRPN